MIRSREVAEFQGWGSAPFCAISPGLMKKFSRRIVIMRYATRRHMVLIAIHDENNIPYIFVIRLLYDIFFGQASALSEEPAVDCLAATFI
jgi:hypothetical protein